MTAISYHDETSTGEGDHVAQVFGSAGDNGGSNDAGQREGLEFKAPAAASRSLKGQWATMVRDIVIGLAALFVGVLGLILPVLPGWILIFVGLALIAGYVPPLRRALSRLLLTNPAARSLASVANRSVTRKGFARLMAMRPVRNAIDSETRWRTLNSVLRARAAGDSESDDDTPTADGLRQEGE